MEISLHSESSSHLSKCWFRRTSYKSTSVLCVIAVRYRLSRYDAISDFSKSPRVGIMTQNESSPLCLIPCLLHLWLLMDVGLLLGKKKKKKEKKE